MNYARKNARFKKVLIIASRSSSPATAAQDSLRFLRFEAVLTEAGFCVVQACAESVARLAFLIEDFKPDIVFSAPDHLPPFLASAGTGSPPPAVNVHGWFEDKGIPYVGSPPDVIELALSKTALKKKWLKEGVATPAFISLDSPEDLSSIERRELPPFPCIVKPSDSGNSRGITKDSVVFDSGSLEKAVAGLGRSFRRIVIEHYLGLYSDFREITCACIGNGGGRLIMPAELVFVEPSGIHVITTEDKDGHRTEARAVADLSLRDSAAAFAASAFASAGVRDYSRCDLAFAGGSFYAIEVNGQPMIPDPWFEACAAGAGLAERDYILAIMDAAMKRIAADRPARG